MRRTRTTSALAITADFAERGLAYWSPGPVTGTHWALDSDGSPIMVDRDGVTITEGSPSATTARIRAAARGQELAAALRAGATPRYCREGHRVIELETPAPAHEHEDGSDTSRCRVLIPFDRSEPVHPVHVLTFAKRPAAA